MCQLAELHKATALAASRAKFVLTKLEEEANYFTVPDTEQEEEE